MTGEIRVGAHRFMKARPGDAGFEIVADRLSRRAAEPLERFEEEGLDIVRLEPARLGPLHLLANPVDARSVHRVVRECALLEQATQGVLVEGVLDDLGQPRADLRLLAVADRVDQQLA